MRERFLWRLFAIHPDTYPRGPRRGAKAPGPVSHPWVGPLYCVVHVIAGTPAELSASLDRASSNIFVLRKVRPYIYLKDRVYLRYGGKAVTSKRTARERERL